MSTLLSRRAFLRTGTIGTIALTTATTSTLTACSSTPPTPSKGFQFLRDSDLKIFSALIPVVLHSMIQTETPNYQALQINILKNIDGACSNLAYSAQGEVYKLLDLLDGRMTRWLTTGVWGVWQQASPTEVNTFLERWQNSSIGPFNAGYRVLSKLVAVSYFSLPESKAQSGYSHLSSLYQAINS